MSAPDETKNGSLQSSDDVDDQEKPVEPVVVVGVETEDEPSNDQPDNEELPESSQEDEADDSGPQPTVGNFQQLDDDIFVPIDDSGAVVIEEHEGPPQPPDAEDKQELEKPKLVEVGPDTAEIHVDLSEVVEELRARLSVAEERAQGFKEMAYRKAADLENTKRRTDKKIEQIKRYGTESVLKEFLPLVDDLERGIEHACQARDVVTKRRTDAAEQPTFIDGRSLGDGTGSSATDRVAEASGTVDTFIDGMTLVLKKFFSTLSRFGVKGFASIGKPFDPHVHEAISQVETDEYPEGAIVSEFLRGYILHDRLMRPALVAVAHPPVTEQPPEQPPEEPGLVEDEPATTTQDESDPEPQEQPDEPSE